MRNLAGSAESIVAAGQSPLALAGEEFYIPPRSKLDVCLQPTFASGV